MLKVNIFKRYGQFINYLYDYLFFNLLIGALTGIFSQMQSNEEVVRERSMKFISNKVMGLGKDIIKRDVEDLIIAECKKVMQNITCEEFETLMTILSLTHLINTPDGQKELVELLASTAELDQFFNPKDLDQVNRFITCLDFAIPFFSVNICYKAQMLIKIMNVILILL